MFCPRPKLRIMLTWVILLGFLQLLLYLVLFGELRSVPRKNRDFKALQIRLEKSLGQGSFIPEMGKIKLKDLEKRLQGLDAPVAFVQDSKRTLSFAKLKQDLSKLEIKSVGATGTSNSRTQVLSDNNSKELPTTKELSAYSKTDLKHSVVVSEEQLRLTGPSDIYFSVKTTKSNHGTRVRDILQTWISIIKEKVYVFTDGDDPELNRSLGGHLVNTHCDTGHQRSALCCKMQAELNYFWDKTKERWFCHVDDDNYVNVPALIKLLREYKHTDSIYLGKTSIARKIKAWDRKNAYKPVSFWFATGGAGFCLSRTLISRMLQYFRNNAFVDTCSRIGLPDDCALGFIIEILLDVRLTRSDLFHSHLEGLQFLRDYELREQVTLSHGYMGSHYNRLKLSGPFSEEDDPSRFKSLHCLLNPATSWCPRNLVPKPSSVVPKALVADHSNKQI